VSNGSEKQKGLAAPADPQFESALDAWDAKANRIKTGMTYQEMVAVAGTPRLVEKVTGWQANVYDPTKYDYGRKWVYFRNQFVAKFDLE